MTRAMWIVVTILTALLLALVYPAVRQQMSQARMSQSRAQLKQIGVALNAYHQQHGSFPPAYVIGPDQQPWHSWRVMLLPFLGQQELYNEYRWDEPWNGPHNAKLQAREPAIYRSPRKQQSGANITTYLAVVSRRSMWPAYFSVSINDVKDGTSNTIQLVEFPASDVNWMEPRDRSEAQTLDLLAPRQDLNRLHDKTTNLVLMADGGVRAVSTWIGRDIVVSLLTPSYQQMMVADDRWPAGLLLETAAESSGTGLIDVETTPGVRLAITLEESIPSDQSTVYCATTQLAWDRLRPGPGIPVAVVDETATTRSLNLFPFPPNSLSSVDYFVGLARLQDEAETSRLFTQFRSQFPHANLELPPAPRELVEQSGGLRILSYLRKTLPFPEVLQRIDEPLLFQKTAVQSFGSLPLHNAEYSSMLTETVLIASYSSDDEFVIVLKTEGQRRDRIVLARIAPGMTLRETWGDVRARLRSHPADPESATLKTIDHLQIPILSFRLQASLKELAGLKIPTDEKPERYVHDSRQVIQFHLDERGAILEADTHLVIGDNEGPGSRVTPKPRHLIFNREFLIALLEQHADEPYFVGWIGNAELMQHVSAPVGDR